MIVLNGYGDAADDIGAEITARVQEMVDINNALYDSAKGDAALTARVDNWHATALAWMKAAPGAAQDQAKLAAWSILGVKIAGNAQDYASEIADASIFSQAGDFIVRLPASAETVAGWTAGAAKKTVQAAGDVVDVAVTSLSKTAQGAALGTGISLLYIVGAAAVGIWALGYGFKKSGAKLRTKYVEAG